MLIDAGRPIDVHATIAGDRVWLSVETVKRALGWELKPEGLCRGDVCVPLRVRAAVVGSDGIDLAGLAAALATLEAPDFALLDLHGRQHSLSEHRGKKVLLVAYASW